jgi:hypothetical protein
MNVFAEEIMNEMLIGYCGLYCGGCGVYQRAVANDPVIDQNGIPMYCEGCRSDRTTKWCTECGIKECNRKKGLKICNECADYPCDMLNGFINDDNYKYHLEVPADMEEMKKAGMEEWAKKKEKAYYCKKCNNLNNWFEQECSKCGAKLVNGK